MLHDTGRIIIINNDQRDLAVPGRQQPECMEAPLDPARINVAAWRFHPNGLSVVYQAATVVIAESGESPLSARRSRARDSRTYRAAPSTVANVAIISTLEPRPTTNAKASYSPPVGSTGMS